MKGVKHVLIVEDDQAVGKVLAALLRQQGVTSKVVLSAEEGLQLLAEEAFDVVVSDVRLPGADGLSLLREVIAKYADTPVIIMTAHGSVALAVEAMKLGATDFVLKPFDPLEVGHAIQAAGVRAQAHARAGSEATPIAFGASSEFLKSASPKMARVFSTLQKVAANTATVLIHGETGTGKELIARSVHALSPRKDHALVRVHCAALPEALLESELFGYEKGAFTGAAARKPGRIELAHKGTLFLDEIGDISLQVQVKLLRVLQEREFERVGGTQTLKVDVRFVAATHCNLEDMVARGTFREDLFYRLNVVPITLPPLRERSEDIEMLVKQFAQSVATDNRIALPAIEPEAYAVLRAYTWPGNIRQLGNLVERLVVLSEGGRIRAVDVERELPSTTLTAGAGLQGEIRALPGSLLEKRGAAERDALLTALAQAKNNRTLAARLLGVSRRTLYNKLEEHQIASESHAK
jgi:DNA-binding NtrC family response regulator